MIYLAYAELAGVPHIVVDGSAQRGTVLTLSHWPGSPTPERYRADLSAEIAYNYAAAPDPTIAAEYVTNNHFDQDGLVSVLALTDPDTAMPRRDRLIDVAHAGDFSRFQSRDAARAAIAIANLAMAIDGDPYPELLPRIAEIVDHVDRFRAEWAEQDAHITASEAALEDGTVTVEEIPEIDLAIVRVPEVWAERVVFQFTTIASNAVHPFALHNATDRLAILTVHGPRVQLQYRYETWVHLVSRRPPGHASISRTSRPSSPRPTSAMHDGCSTASRA